MPVNDAIEDVLQLKQEFEALCEEAVARVEALEERLSDVDPPGGQDPALPVSLVNRRNDRSQFVLAWSFSDQRFMVRDQGRVDGGQPLLDRTDDWTFIELVASLPKLLPKVEASILQSIPEKKLLIAAARAALDACGDPEENEEGDGEPEPVPARFAIIG